MIQADARSALERFDPAVRRRVNPHAYPAGLESALHARREALIESAPLERRARTASPRASRRAGHSGRRAREFPPQMTTRSSKWAGLRAILAVRERAGHVATHGSNAGIDVGSQNLSDSPGSDDLGRHSMRLCARAAEPGRARAGPPPGPLHSRSKGAPVSAPRFRSFSITAGCSGTPFARFACSASHSGRPA